MSEIYISVNDQELHITAAPLISAGGIKENYVNFDFSSEWAGFLKIAVFHHSETPDTKYQSVCDTNGRALIPHEVTAKKGTLYISVNGINDDVILTSEIVKYKIVAGEYLNTEPSSPDIYDQFLEMAETIHDAVDAINAARAITKKRFDQTFTISSNTSSVTFSPTDYAYDESDRFEVYVNGLKLTNSEFSTSDGSIAYELNAATITFATPIAGSEEIVEVVCYKDIVAVADIEDKVNTWLDDHPEATTTVQDGSITPAKLNSALRNTITEIPVLSQRVENLLDESRPGSVTTLWTGSIRKPSDSATLSENVSEFDFLDIYALSGTDTKFIRVPSSQTSVQIQAQNMSDNGSDPFLYLWETGVGISGTTVTVNKCVLWSWLNPNQGSATYDSPTVTANAENGPAITRIDGVKMSDESPAELLDIRVGADGTTYASAGAAVRNQISDLKADFSELESAFNAVVETADILSDPVEQSAITRLVDKNFTSIGNIQDKTGWSILYWQADVEGLYDIVLSYTQAQNKINIYSSSDFSSATLVSEATKITNVHFRAQVTAGQYIAIHAWNTSYTAEIRRKTGESYSIPDISEKIKAEEDNIFPNGWMHLPVENFSRNEWNGYNSTTNRNYRVKYNLPIQFNRDVVLLASPGFYLSGYKSDGVATDPATTINLPANTLFKVYVRRITEDASEVADIDEFANALTVSTPLAGMEKYKHTFTDVTMFERVGICGDSYAAGGGIISGIRALTWGKNLERQAGIIVDIYAKSGETIVQWNVDNTNGLPALLSGDECGLYWLQHGINGTSTPEALGTAADMSADPRPATFYGQYVEAIEQIQSTFPNSRIVLATITGSGYGLNQTVYKPVNEAITAIAAYCNVPLIDITQDDFYKSPWYDNNCRSNHPTAMLNAGIAHANRRLIARCIMNNPSYFIEYGSN